MTTTRRAFMKTAGLGAGAVAMMPLSSAFAQARADRLIVVSNGGGDGIPPSMTLIDPDRLEVALTLEAPASFSFPATRWAYKRDVLWGGYNGFAAGFSLETGEKVAEVATEANQNYTELTPDGAHLIVAARSNHRILKIDARRGAGFGTIVGMIQHYEGSQPCDMTMLADGSLCFTPDREGDTVSVFRIDPFELVATLPVESMTAEPLEPFMATVSPRGDYLFVENAQGDGSESIIDISNPAQPVEVKRLTQADGLGLGAITDEFTPDGRYCVIICRGSNELTVVDVDRLEVRGSVPLPEGSNPVAGTFMPEGDRMFLPLPGRDAVAVISVPAFEIETLVPVGGRPMGAAYVENPAPQQQGMAIPLGVHMHDPRVWPENCPDRCCGPIV